MLLENSLVHTQDGLKNIKDVSLVDCVLTNDMYDDVTGITYKSCYKQVVTVITQDGELQCTSDQYVAVLKNCTEHRWKKARDLKKDDVLLTTRRPVDGVITKFLDTEIEMTTYLAWFIGILHSKDPYIKDMKTGYISWRFEKEDYSIAIRMKDMLNILEEVLESKNEADIDMQRYYGEITYYTVHYRSPNVSQRVYDFICNMLNSFSIPEYIWNGLVDIRLAYIAGIIDGNVHCKPLSQHNKKAFNICKMSSSDSVKAFVKLLQCLCYSCGMETRLVITQGTLSLNAMTKYSLNMLLNVQALMKFVNVISYIDTNMSLCNLNSFPIKMVNGKNKLSRRFHSSLGIGKLKNISVDRYDQIFGDISYCPVKVRFICKTTGDQRPIDVFNIKMANKEEFYCNGYLLRSQRQE
jgi:hypothetical protein